MAKSISLKMHHILIIMIIIFVILGAFLLVSQSIKKSAQEFRSHYMPSDVLIRLAEGSMERMYNYNLGLINDTPSEDLGLISVVVLKQEKKIEIWLPKHKKKAVLDIDRLSPGRGLKYKKFQSVFPEGVYKIEEVGLNDKHGFFIQLTYPNETHKKDQKIQEENFEGDALLISSKEIFSSYLVLGEDEIEDLCYIILKAKRENVEVLVYPHRPPLKISLENTYALVKTFQDLNQKYKDLSEKVSNE